MATGRLGVADLAADTLVTLYTCPTNTFTVASVSFCNRGNSAVGVRLAVADTDTPNDSEYIEFDTEILGKGVLERTGIILGSDQRLVVRSSSVGVSTVAFGIETPTI